MEGKSQIPTQEVVSPLEKVAREGIEIAFTKIRERYENPKDPDEKLDYHSTLHTASVLSRVERIAKAMGLDEKAQALARLGAAYHDVYQDDQDREKPGGETLLRHRLFPQNEEKSAAEAVEWMKTQPIFTNEDCEIVSEAVLVTVPDHDDQGRLYQPRLKPDSHPVVRAVALADLNASGIDGKKFAEEADPLIREFEIEITRKLRELKSRSELSAADQERFKKKIISWRERQVTFAEKRQSRLELELEGLNDEQKNNVRALFTKFDEAIEESKRVAEERKKMPFWELAEATGYTVPAQ